MNIFTQFFSKLFASPASASDIERDLIRKESEIGRQLFGPIPHGTKRDFFRLDTHTWVWREENAKGTRTTRYVVQGKTLVKSVNSGHFERVSDEESQYLLRAAKLYVQRVNSELYEPVLRSS